jgi:hypothetical protein
MSCHGTENEGCTQSCTALIEKTRWSCLSPAATLSLVVNETGATYSNTHSMPCCSVRKLSSCRRIMTNAGWWVIMWSIPHMFQITMHVSLQSPYQCWYSLNAAREFPSQKAHMKCISTLYLSRHFCCCQRSCYRYYCLESDNCTSAICMSTNSLHRAPS